MNLYGIAAGVGVIITIGLYFLWTQNTIANQHKELLAYEITVQSQLSALDALEDDIQTIKNINNDLTTIERSAAENASALADTLGGIGRIAVSKPSIVEDLINDSAIARIRCFSLATGADSIEGEINKTCPHLIGE